jgi:hypothetical protein
MKAYFEGFQCCELISGEVATPASPRLPDLASGAIVRKVTAGAIGFAYSLSPVVITGCPDTGCKARDKENDNIKNMLNRVDIIFKRLRLNRLFNQC